MNRVRTGKVDTYRTLCGFSFRKEDMYLEIKK